MANVLWQEIYFDQSTKSVVYIQSCSHVTLSFLIIFYFALRLYLKLKTTHLITTSHCCLVHMDIPHTEDHKKWNMNVAKNKLPSIIQNVIATCTIYSHAHIIKTDLDWEQQSRKCNFSRPHNIEETIRSKKHLNILAFWPCACFLVIKKKWQFQDPFNL